jgi:hypothetical protein
MAAVRTRGVALASILLLALASSGPRAGASAQQPGDQPPADLSSDALAQIDALIAEKDARSPAQRKIDSQLLYAQRMESGQPVADGIWSIETDVPYADDGHVVVDVTGRPGGTLAARMRAAGIDVLSASADGASIRAHVDLSQLEPLAADNDVVFIQPKQNAAIAQATTNLI